MRCSLRRVSTTSICRHSKQVAIRSEHRIFFFPLWINDDNYYRLSEILLSLPSGSDRKVFYRPQSLSHHKANIWVVRYVDYTSKYGLGFLLNTGSAGVYFNDSTKIVASPDGTVFQYSERRKKEKGSTSSEHSIQTHFMSKYPSELQKKVTLLRHFRNYLVDQQKEGELFALICCTLSQLLLTFATLLLKARHEETMVVQQEVERNWRRSQLSKVSNCSCDSCNFFTMLYRPWRATLVAWIMSDRWLFHFSGASLGANASIPFGASSTTLRSSDAMQMGCCNSPSGPGDVDPEPKMPFLKKWVRTRHAILFRLSNRTVQVLFFDRRWESLFSWLCTNIKCDDTQNEILNSNFLIRELIFIHILPNFAHPIVRYCCLLRQEWWRMSASRMSDQSTLWKKCFKQVSRCETTRSICCVVIKALSFLFFSSLVFSAWLTNRSLIWWILSYLGRTDIAKRLKYAKDIMYRLISTQAS